MASFKLTLHIGETIRVLTVVEAAFDDPSPLMSDVLLIMIRSTQQNFEAQGRPVHWAKLAESTVYARLARLGVTGGGADGESREDKMLAELKRRPRATKDKRTPKQIEKAIKKAFAAAAAYEAAAANLKILRDFGLLAQSVGADASGEFSAEDGFGSSDDRFAVIGTNRPGADALQDGVKERKLPARPYILFQEQDVEDVADMAIAWALRTGPYALA